MSKKFKILVVTMVVIMAMIVPSAIVMAQEGEDTATAPLAEQLFARVAGILGVDQGDLENAFEQAREEMGEEAPDWCTGNATASRINERLANRRQVRQMLGEGAEDCIQEKLQNRQQIRQQLQDETLDQTALRARTSQAMRGRRMMAIAER